MSADVIVRPGMAHRRTTKRGRNDKARTGRAGVISVDGPEVVDVNTHACRGERAQLGSCSSVSSWDPAALANSLNP
jgi:hypothetical protein